MPFLIIIIMRRIWEDYNNKGNPDILIIAFIVGQD
jgi:hypothetical protein